MKKLLLASILLLSSLMGFAQELTIEGVSGRGFSGVKSLDGTYFYTFYFGEKSKTNGMANFILSIYDKDLKEVKITEIEISKRSRLAASSFNGNTFLFVFADVSAGIKTTISMDKQGDVIKSNVEKGVRSRLLLPENYPVIHPLKTDEFIVIQPEKEKKFGYEVERIGRDLTSVYKKSFFPDRGLRFAEDSKLKNGILYILRNNKSTALGEEHVYAIQALNAETGDQIYLAELINENDGGFPDFIAIDDKGIVATGGMYFKNSKYDEKNSDGLFFALIAPDGSTLKYSKTTWNAVKDKIQGEFSTALIGGKTKVLIEDVVLKKDGSYLVVGETWRKSNYSENTGAGAMMSLAGMGSSSSSSSGRKEKGFTVMDFAMFNFDANGYLTGIDKIEKETKEAVVRGSLAEERGLGMAQGLYKRKFFCYRNTIEANGKQYIMYKNNDGYKEKAYFLPVGASSSKGIGTIDMDKWMSEGVNAMGKLSKLTSGNKYTFDNLQFDSVEPELFKNIAPAGEGKVMLYHLNFKGILKVWIESVPQ